MSDWRPGADGQALRQRAELLACIRDFFRLRGVLEVETPLLCTAGVTDPAIEPFMVAAGTSIGQHPRYLQTSPEYAMKRLLAAGSGPIYQISKAFRDGEAGGRHNPEFTLLEWYRPGIEHHQLMQEVELLVTACLGDHEVRKLSYRELFSEFVQLDPFTASIAQLADRVRQQVDVGDLQGDRDMWLDLLLTHIVEPALSDCGAVFVYDYPASQAALSNIVRCDDVEVGQRFELYFNGVELANGYCELTDASVQRERFLHDNQRREASGQVSRPLDTQLLAAMEHGLPPCSGVALGVDRLAMLYCQRGKLDEVLSFSWMRS